MFNTKVKSNYATYLHSNKKTRRMIYPASLKGKFKLI